MSQPLESTTETLPLAIQTGDSQSEILVLDSKGRLLIRGFGPDCTFQLEPGIYRVKVLTGTASQEQPVVLTAPRILRFGPIDFASAAPLAGTSTSHEYHVQAADQESRKVHVTEGTDSSLFFLVRNWTAPGSQSQQRVSNNPAEGLSLHAAGPGADRKICDFVGAGVTSPPGDPWTACTVAVNPGVYELQLVLPAGEILRQPVVASRGWQTQSFLFVRQYVGPEGPAWRADLARTSVLLTGVHGGFNPNEAILRVAELARQRLARRTLDEQADNTTRPLLPDEMRKLLREKFDNPMLGIYAAHLMLLERSLDLALFRDVVGNLRSMLPGHPDVDALALRAQFNSAPGVFENPPMLSRSWFLITEASVDHPDLVSDWLAQRSVGNVLTQGAWHVLRAEELSAADAVDIPRPSTHRVQQAIDTSNGSAEDSLAVGASEKAGAAGTITPSEPYPMETMSQPGMPDGNLHLTEIESAVAEALGIGKKIRWSEMQRTQTAQQGATENIEEDMDPARLRGVATRFGIPAPQLKGLLSGLERKLNSNSLVPNLSVKYK
jgi:hypothetical protein